MLARAVDLLCGCGGFSEGARLAGVDVAGGVDADSDAASAYALNFGNAMLGDVQEPSVRARVAALRLRVLLGSPPCTNFYGCGLGREGEVTDLTVIFASIACECRPKAFLMENAPRVLSSRAYETARVVLNAGGYSTVAAVLSAYNHGVAQTRRRAFVFSARDPTVAHRVAAALRAARPAPPVCVRDVVPHAGDHVFCLPRNHSQPGDGASAPELLSAGRATTPSKYSVRDGASAPELHSAKTCHISEQILFLGRSVSPGTTFCRTCHIPEQILFQGRSVSPGTTFCGTCHISEQILFRGWSVSPRTTFCGTCHISE